MILSEFAGAAQSLNGSLLVNPCEWIVPLAGTLPSEVVGDVQSTADAINTALTMTPDLRKSNWQKLYAVSAPSIILALADMR